MLEHVPAWLGKLLINVRAGHEQLVIVQPDIIGSGPVIELSSPAFAAGGRLPIRFTADGEGISPPLIWSAPPAGTASVALIVEDPDAPSLHPLVHALIWDLPVDEQRLAEGAITNAGAQVGDVGRNSYFGQGWLPPDPPTGHGEHDYVFQLFALDEDTVLGETPGRSDMIDAMRGHVLATGLLVGTYSREAQARKDAANARLATGQVD